jgi:cell division protein FtsB
MPAPKRLPLSRRVIVFVVAAAALAILIAAAVGDRGYLAARRRQTDYIELQQKIHAVETDNARLLADIKALKEDPYVVEKLARERLGFARPGEVIYMLPPSGK